MNAKELRIGNVVINRLLSTVSGEYLVTSDVFAFIENNPDQDIYHPILLHEEYLGRFGFKKIEGFDDAIILIKDDVELEFVTRYSTCAYLNYLNNECKYVHQLQNLYFALTNKELILNN